MRTIILACIFLLCSGCGFTASNYSASVRNIEQLRLTAPTGAAVRVSRFESPKGPIKKLSCRMNPLTLPGDGSYEDYIREALINELRLAGAYSETASSELRVVVDTIEPSSSMFGGHWDLKLGFSADGIAPFTIEHKHEFSTGYDGGVACERVGSHLVTAVQEFIGDLFRSDRFIEVLRKSASAQAKKPA